MTTFALVLQIINALLLIVLMAAQSEKAEQGGVMGLGSTGGRQAGSIDMMVGPERILKPATKWSAIGLLFTSMFSAMPEPTIWKFLILLVVYLVIMLFGERVWRSLLGLNA